MSQNRPPYGEQAPPLRQASTQEKPKVKFGPAHYFWMLVLAAVIAPGIIALWKWVLGW